MKKPIIPHSRPTLGKEEVDAVTRVIASGQIAQGREVDAFEQEFANKVGVKYAAAASSGTAALHLSLIALGVSPGDEVIIPSYVCTALLNAVNYTGATPVIADIETGTLNLDPVDVAGRITPRTKAIIVPHMFGLMAEMGGLKKLGVPLIEDCAQAVGAVSGNRMAGSLGEIGTFSFYATKMMTCGEGGMVVSNSKDIIARVRQSREYDNRDDYAVRFNYKMTDIQAATGRIQLKKLPGFIARRREIAGLYTYAFNDFENGVPPQESEHIFYRYNIAVDQDVSWWIEQMKHVGITCATPIYKPLHHYLGDKSCPRTELAFKRTLSIPIYPTLSDIDVDRVIAAVVDTLQTVDSMNS